MFYPPPLIVILRIPSHVPPVEKVQTHWDGTQHGVELRRQQLEAMVADSLRWEDRREEAEELVRRAEARLFSLQQARRDPLTKQVADNQVRRLRVLAFFLVSSCWTYFFLL